MCAHRSLALHHRGQKIDELEACHVLGYVHREPAVGARDRFGGQLFSRWRTKSQDQAFPITHFGDEFFHLCRLQVARRPPRYPWRGRRSGRSTAVISALHESEVGTLTPSPSRPTTAPVRELTDAQWGSLTLFTPLNKDRRGEHWRRNIRRDNRGQCRAR